MPLNTVETGSANNYQQLLDKCLAVQTANIQCHILENNEKVWVRRADPHHAMWPYYILGAVAKLLRADALKPVPSLGGVDAIKNEAHKLQTLKEHNILAPTLLAQNEQALMMSNISDESDLMKALLKAKQENDNEKVFSLWCLGVSAIAEVHNKNQHLNQCFARNMMLCSNETTGYTIGFIDFEDNPAQYLSLEECQIRDWLCYMHSTVLLLDDEPTLKQAMKQFKAILGDKADCTIEKINKNIKYMKWLRYFKNRKRWGKDTIRIAAFMRLFSI